MSSPRVVALGGGHGLFATLTSLRALTSEITAIVTVADNGGSSGRLREEFPIFPPGVYEKQFEGMGIFLGTGRIASKFIKYRSAYKSEN